MGVRRPPPALSGIVTLLVCILLLGTVTAYPDERGSTPPYSGLPLTEVLRQLQAGGLRVIFSSDLVLPEMRVLSEPTAGEPLAQLREMLAPHGLTVESGPGGTVLVVRNTAATAEPAGTIEGTVRCRDTRLPLAGILVSLPALAVETFTDRDGGFFLPDIPAGTHLVDVRAIGYHAQQIDIPVTANATVSISFDLIPTATFLREIVVTPSYLGILRDEPEPRQFLSRLQVEQTPHLADDLYRAIGRLPGTARSDLSAQFNLRGGARDEVLVVLDGLELYEPFHFPDALNLFSAIDSEAIGGVDLLSGGFPVDYGNRLSGVIDISSVTPSSKPETALGASFVTARSLSEGSFADGRGTWLLSARRGYLDLIMSWVNRATDDDGDADSERLEPSFWDTLGKLSYQVDEQTTITGNILYSSDDILVRDEEEMLRAASRNTYLWANHQKAWTPALFSQTVLSIGSLDRQRRGYLEQVDAISSDRSLRLHGLKQHWSLDLSDRYYLRWGVDAKRLSARYRYHASAAEHDESFPFGPSFTGSRTLQVKESGAELAAFMASRFRLSKPLVAELGVRWDRQTYLGEQQLSPRLNLVYTRGATAVRASWGRFFQAQRLNELPVEEGVTEFSPPQQADHSLLSVEHAFANHLVLRAELYHKEVSDPHPRYENLFEPTTAHPEIRYDRLPVVPTRAEAKGVELLLKQDSGNPSWWLSYALARTEDEIDGRMVPRRWDQRHTVRCSMTWLLKKGWTLSVLSSYHSGWPTTDVSWRFDVGSDGSLTPQAMLGPVNGARMRPYHRLDLRAGHKVPLSDGGSFSFFVEVINVFNRHNYNDISSFRWEWATGSKFPDSYTEWDSWLPVVPAFGFTWRF